MLLLYLATIEDLEQKNKFEYIYRNYFQFMCQTAYAVIRTPDLAEEAVHETFLQILKEIDTLRIDSKSELKSYLYILTRERSIDFLRRWERRKGAVLFEDESMIVDNIEEPESIVFTHIQLKQALSILLGMPAMYRKALMLRIKGYSIKEIATITQTTEANVKSRIFRARKIILNAFK